MGYKTTEKPAVMVTGCAGFIGSHMVDRLLTRGYNVVGVDCFSIHGSDEHNLDKARQYSEFDFALYPFDICDTTSIRSLCHKYGVKWILNFAAETHVDRSIIDARPFIHSNVEGVTSLLEVCRETREKGTKLLHISTDEVYGPWTEGLPGNARGFAEYENLNPQNPYSATKAAAEHMIQAYHNTYGVPYLMFRPCNNFGPRQDGEKLIPTIVQSILEPCPVPVYGDGKQVRDWMYVEDTVLAIEEMMWKITNTKDGQDCLNHTYNLTCKDEKENIEIVSAAIKHFGKGEIKNVEDRLGHDRKYCISDKKINDVLNMSQFYKRFEKNLLTTFKWHETKYLKDQKKKFYGHACNNSVSFQMNGLKISDANE